jgi:hypothetical protein
MMNICLVCGWISDKHFFKEDSSEPNWNNNICSCCNFEFGIDETAFGKISYLQARKEWILNGCHFIDNKDWNIHNCLNQLENLKNINIKKYPIWIQEINIDWNDETNEFFVEKNFNNL